MHSKQFVIVTPWFDGFVGGAGTQAKGLACEFNRRGVKASVFTTCSLSPYDDWWHDHYPPGRSEIAGIETHRFPVNTVRAPYEATIRKLGKGSRLTTNDEQNFFKYGINSDELIAALEKVLEQNHEVLALPYFQGLTYSTLVRYPGQISLIPCFHDEPQFYWGTTKDLLTHAKHIFYNSPEEKQLAIRHYGQTVGRRIVEGVVTGEGVEEPCIAEQVTDDQFVFPESYFVYVGRKERGKNVPLLCDWFTDYVRQTGTRTKLVFIGGGDKQLLPHSPHILDFGPVSEATKQRVIRGAKGLINLSVNESFSIVIMEGWLKGVPAIVSAQCAVTTGHVRRANGGLFVQSNADFSDGLNYLESNEHVRTQLGANGAAYVSRNFSYDVVLAKYLDVFSANGYRPAQ